MWRNIHIDPYIGTICFNQKSIIIYFFGSVTKIEYYFLVQTNNSKYEYYSLVQTNKSNKKYKHISIKFYDAKIQ